jgi:hypothetical protein
MKSHLSRRYQADTTISCQYCIQAKKSLEKPKIPMVPDTSCELTLPNCIAVDVLERLLKV